MALLRLLSDPAQPLVRLRARHLIGRSNRCDLRLREPSVSGEHALVTFSDGAWWVRDLGSRNGTRVDELPLDAGASRELALNHKLSFAGSGPWAVVDLDPPLATAVALDGGKDLELDGGMLALPSEDDPEILVTQALDGRWLIQRETGDEFVEDGHIVEVGGRRFQLSLPTSLSATLTAAQSALRVDTCSLLFHVSLNEEVVEVTVRGPGRSEHLPERVHHYVLLHLSRLRKQDVEQGLPPHECGWIPRPQLATDLRLSEASLNVQLYRARKQLADAGLLGAEELIERRGREIRLVVERVEEQPLGA